MFKLKVGVLRGGPSSEYEVSLKTGANVLKFLPSKYEGVDIFITRNGEWHREGIKMPLNKIFRGIDLVFNALHGEFGEDGKVQQILEQYKTPFTGSASMPSAFAMNKFLSRRVFENAGIKIPDGFLIKKSENLDVAAEKIFKKYSPPWVLKVLNKGSSVGVEIARDFHGLKNTIKEFLKENDKILFEEYIKGKEATCGVLDNFRNERHYALPPVEIIPPEKNSFFDYEAKYSGETKEICPGNFDMKTKNLIQEYAKKAHSALGCKGYSRTDFMVSPRGVYALELNNQPGLTSQSLLPKSAAAIGLTFPSLLDHLIKVSLK